MSSSEIYAVVLLLAGMSVFGAVWHGLPYFGLGLSHTILPPMRLDRPVPPRGSRAGANWQRRSSSDPL
jgi:hypothetical protein